MPVYSAGMILLFVLMFFFSIAMVLHIIQAVGLSDIAKDQGEEKHWLAWIPVGNIILMMMLVEKTNTKFVKNKMVIYFGVLVLLTIITLPFFVSGDIPLLSNPFMPLLIPVFWCIFSFRTLAERYTIHGVSHMFLSLVTIGLAIPFQLYAFRNTIPVSRRTKK